MGDHFRMGKPPRHGTRHPVQLSLGYSSVGKQNEYWLWLWPPLGKNSESCITVAHVTRTAGIAASISLKPLAVNGAGHPADLGCMLA